MGLNSGWTYREVIRAPAAGQSLLDYLSNTYRHSSRDEWRVRISAALVRIDGCPVDPDRRLVPGDIVTWERPPWTEPEVPVRLDVLHEDEALVAVSKPRGLPTMPGGGFLEHTLLALVRQRYPEARPAHRLGRHTSGVVLCSLGRESAASLAAAWRAHEVQKDYLALVTGQPSWDELEILAPIGPVPHPLLGTIHGASRDGRPSRSLARVLHRGSGASLCRVTITTGRPHQVRIHLAWAGHPLVGDPVYGHGGIPTPGAGLPGDPGYLLHAEHLGFLHPRSNRWMDLYAPVPRDLTEEGRSCTGG